MYVCVSVCWGRNEICRCFSQGVYRVFVYVCLEGLGSQCNPPNCCMQTFLLPRPSPNPRRGSEWAGKGAWVRLWRGAWAKKGGFSLEQNNNTGQRGPQGGNNPSGGRSWEKKPRQERGGGGRLGKRKDQGIWGGGCIENPKLSWAKYCFSQIWGRVACLALFVPVWNSNLLWFVMVER